MTFGTEWVQRTHSTVNSDQLRTLNSRRPEKNIFKKIRNLLFATFYLILPVLKAFACFIEHFEWITSAFSVTAWVPGFSNFQPFQHGCRRHGDGKCARPQCRGKPKRTHAMVRERDVRSATAFFTSLIAASSPRAAMFVDKLRYGSWRICLLFVLASYDLLQQITA